jgi:hypothetical protein
MIWFKQATSKEKGTTSGAGSPPASAAANNGDSSQARTVASLLVLAGRDELTTGMHQSRRLIERLLVIEELILSLGETDDAA